jgi:hypothetical protein
MKRKMAGELRCRLGMSAQHYGLEVGPGVRSIWGGILTALALAACLCTPVSAQLSMQRPGITGIPQARKSAAAARSATTLTPGEQKRLATVIQHMNPKDRKKLAKALQKMTPQQRQQLVASVKQQLGQAKKSSR